MRNFLLCLMILGSMAVAAQENKTPYSLRESMRSKRSGDSITVSLLVNSHFSSSSTTILSAYGNIITARIAMKDLSKLVADTSVLFINEQVVPREELTTGATDFTLNKINLAHNKFPQLNGDSLKASIKERLFDTTDIDLKGRVFKTGLENNFVTAHASLMTTTIAGGGNTSPFALGAAWKSAVSSSSFLNLLPDADAIMQQYKISLQNHSYGTAVENFYGNEAAGYDRQMNVIPTLVHVFSSGNSGNVTNTAGPYSGITQVANLTGNFKQAKNIITVGSVDSSGQLMPLSSKGPAYDGRIKPELMAYGEDGSSGAAALVSGAVLLVQDGYKRLHAGNLPASSLVKSILVNSADDIGNANPDHATGYGSLNAYKALTTVTQDRYFENSIAAGQTKTFNIIVPPGISKLKLTLCWNDPAAQPNAQKAMVNDLDLDLKLPSTGETWLPWVLSAKANIDSLQAPAQRRIDTLNTVEQVTLDNPVAGNYLVEVNASHLATASQGFSIAYQFDTASVFYWTYPSSTDPLIAGNRHWLRWETNISGSGIIEYATNGNNWRTVGNVSDLSSKFFKWTLPDTSTVALLRMKIVSNNTTIISDSFTISPQLNLQVGFNCPDSFLLYWNALSPNNYRLYEMGPMYLQPFTQTATASVILGKQQHPDIYYAVAPLINNREGFRSSTLNYTSQGVECYFQSFFLQSQSGRTALFTATLGSTYHLSEVRFEKFNGSSFSAIATINNPTVTAYNFSDTALKPGLNLYRLQLRLQNGTILYSNTETVYYTEPSHPVILFPNPVSRSGVLNVIANESGRYGLRIFDSGGRLVYSKDLNSSRTVIQGYSLVAGIYFVQVTDKQGRPVQQKLVVY